MRAYLGDCVTNQTIPVVYAQREGAYLVFRCEHCGVEHVHGVCSGGTACLSVLTRGRLQCICPSGSGDGHRVAHCSDPTSPYYMRGYFLVERG